MSVARFAPAFAVALMTLAATSATQTAHAEEPKMAPLLERSPSPANAIAYVNFPSLKKLMADASMLTKMSDNLEEVWLVSEIDTGNVRPRWEAGYATLKKEVTPKALADAVGGYVDQVADKDVVWSPQEMYLVPMPESRLGFLRPANRSLLSQWIDPGINVNDTGYLTEQAKQPEQFLSFMVAVQLKDAFSPVPLANRLSGYKSLKAQPAESVANILASVEGLSVIVGRTSLSQCILRVDFAKSPASLLPIASDLLGEVLEHMGAAAPEVLTWKATAAGNRLSFQGPITEDSLEALLGIFSVRDQAERVAKSLVADSSSDPVKIQKSDDNRIAYTSKSYFDEIGTIVDRTRKYHAQTTGARALWNDQQARRIDDMGTLNVDPMMLQYSSDVSSLLRGNALTIRKGNMAAGATKAQEGLSSGYSYSWGYGYGSAYYNPNTSADYKRVTDVQTMTTAYADYASVLSQIDQMSAEIRRAMTEKYKVQF